MSNLKFYLSLASFLISLGGGAYFFALWLRKGVRHGFVLCWSIGLGFLLWFKIPNILANAGMVIVLEDFYKFFFATLLMYLLSYLALIKGFSFFTKCPRSGLMSALSVLLFMAGTVYFSLSFLIPGFELTYAPVWASHALFYIPAQLFLLYELWRVKKDPAALPLSRANEILIGLGIFSLLASSVLYIAVQAWAYPIQFWYISAISNPAISFLQVIGGLSLFFGLRSLTKAYFLSGK